MVRAGRIADLRQYRARLRERRRFIADHCRHGRGIDSGIDIRFQCIGALIGLDRALSGGTAGGVSARANKFILGQTASETFQIRLKRHILYGQRQQ